MLISIFDNYSIFDVGKLKNIDIIITQMPDLVSDEVSIDFTNCLIDYPATSKLVDRVLGELSKKSGNKRLIALSDLTINNENLILSLMVWGSEYFDFSTIQRTSNASEYSQIMNKKLKQNEIVFQIHLLNDDNSLFKEYTYG